MGAMDEGHLPLFDMCGMLVCGRCASSIARSHLPRIIAGETHGEATSVHAHTCEEHIAVVGVGGSCTTNHIGAMSILGRCSARWEDRPTHPSETRAHA